MDIDRLNAVIDRFEKHGTFTREDFPFLMALLNKQKPAKPYRNTIHYPYTQDIEVVQCPACKRRLRTNRTTKEGDAFCPDCGQAIDWRET